MQIENHKEEVPFAHYEEKFRHADPMEMAKRSGIDWDGSRFHIVLMHKSYVITHPVCTIRALVDGTVPPLPVQTFLLRYLLEGKAATWTGGWKTFRELPWGEVYHRSFSGRCLTRAAFAFGTRIAAFRATAEKILLQANAEAQMRTEESEIVRRAHARAKEIFDQVQMDTDGMYKRAYTEVNKMLSGATAALNRSAMELADLRDQLLSGGDQNPR